MARVRRSVVETGHLDWPASLEVASMVPTTSLTPNPFARSIKRRRRFRATASEGYLLAEKSLRNVSMGVRPRSVENRDQELGVGLASFTVGLAGGG